MVKVEPCPSTLSTETEPSWTSASSLTRARPMPAPWCLRRAELSACQNRPKTFGSWLLGIPMPESWTARVSWLSTWVAIRATDPPESVNLRALKRRFRRIFSTLSRSSLVDPISGEYLARRLTFLPCATPRTALRRPLRKELSSTASRRTSMRPDSSRTRSRRSLMSLRRRMPLACMVESRSWASSSFCFLDWMMRFSSGASSSVSGVRSSWLMLAKKWLLAWSSSSSFW